MRLAVAMAVLCVVLAGCVIRAPVVPPQGILFSNTSVPLGVEMRETKINWNCGKASTYNVLGLVAWGDASIKAAAVDARLKKVNHLDYKQLNVMYLFQMYTTIAYGD